MIGGDDEQIILPHFFKYLRKPCIEFFKRFPVPFRIAAVSEQRVKINEVHKADACKVLVKRLNQFVHPIHVRCCSERFGNSFAVVDIGDFSDGYDI